MNLAYILKDYVTLETLNYKLMRNNKLFYAKYNIDLDAKFTPISVDDINQGDNDMQGGTIFSTKMKDTNYSFAYYKINNFTNTDGKNYTKGIIIKRNNTVDNDLHSSSKHCALLLYDNYDLLKIAFLNMHSDCYESVDKNKYGCILACGVATGCILACGVATGSVLLKLIILWAKNQNFKRIVLSDQSQFTCKDNSYLMSYELKYIHTLTHGTTWYSKYGFKFINQVDNDALAYNKQFLDNFKTEEYPFELLMKIIMHEIVDQKIYVYMDKYDYLLNINKIVTLYDEYKIKPFYKFIKIISRESCFLVSHIYMKIFESLKLKKYIASEMELIINN